MVEMFFELYVDGVHLGRFSESFCREYCRQFANIRHVKCIKV